VDRILPAALVIAFLLLLLVLMLLGWRARARRQSGIARPATAPADLGRILVEADALYVGTTIAGDPLNRVTVKGLGFRARAALTVAERGVVLGIPGQADVFIARERLTGVGRATWTIDRTVEPDGLLLVGWQLGDGPALTAVESYARITGDASIDEVIARISDLISATTESESA